MTAYRPSVEWRTAGRGRAPHQFFLLIAPFLYAFYALLTPPFQTPDEHQHLFRAWQLSEFQIVGERRGSFAGGVLPESLGRAAAPQVGTLKPHSDRRPVLERPISEAFSAATPVTSAAPDRFYDFRGSVIYSPAGYLPQIGAIWIGKALGLSIENILRLGRLLNASMAIFLIYWALRLTPVGASVLLFVSLFPMTAAASASFGQDGSVIGCACLLTALGLRNMCARKQELRNLLPSAAVATTLALCKILYLPLALIGVQPFLDGKFRLWRLWPSGTLAALAGLLSASWLWITKATVVAPWPNVPPAGSRLASTLSNPSVFLSVLQHSYIDRGPVLLDSLFEFGWLNVPSGSIAPFLCAVACGLFVISGDPAAGRLRWQTRVWLIGCSVAAALLISLAAWLYGTPAGMDSIFGLQGRYFIPLLPAVLIALLPARKTPSTYGRFVPFLMVGANLLVLTAIVRAFYSF